MRYITYSLLLMLLMSFNNVAYAQYQLLVNGGPVFGSIQNSNIQLDTYLPGRTLNIGVVRSKGHFKYGLNVESGIIKGQMETQHKIFTQAAELNVIKDEEVEVLKPFIAPGLTVNYVVVSKNKLELSAGVIAGLMVGKTKMYYYSPATTIAKPFWGGQIAGIAWVAKRLGVTANIAWRTISFRPQLHNTVLGTGVTYTGYDRVTLRYLNTTVGIAYKLSQ